MMSGVGGSDGVSRPSSKVSSFSSGGGGGSTWGSSGSSYSSSWASGRLVLLVCVCMLGDNVRAGITLDSDHMESVWVGEGVGWGDEMAQLIYVHLNRVWGILRRK